MVQGTAQSRFALPAIAVGILAVSASAIFIRLAEAPAVAIAFWRCALGVMFLAPFAAVRAERLPKGGALLAGTASGVALGAHFGFWIASLDYTSVAASVVLVSTTPVFVAIAAYFLFRERTSLMSFAGILVAIAGTVLVAGGGASSGEGTFFGNMLALIGAVAMAGYVLIGRSLRTSGLGVLSYSVVVYSTAAGALLITALLFGIQMWGYSWETWFWLFAITLGPQILGHTVFNWALEHVEASLVSGTILAEPVIAALLAWMVLSERPGAATLVGGGVVLAGLFFLLRGRQKAPVPPS